MTKIAEQAEILCSNKFTRIASATKYVASFSTRLGRNLALQRTQQAIYCWSQIVALEGAPASPVRKYDAKETRNSNLNAKNAPLLTVGNAIYYWKFDSAETFQEFIDWYGQ